MRLRVTKDKRKYSEKGDYKKLIINMVKKIDNIEYLKAIYWFVKRLKD